MCIHFWVIEEAQGRYSMGTCNKCGATKRFRNFLEELDYLTNTDKRLGQMW